MEAFGTIFTVILFIFGILQIILFFKIWGMCNDIADMNQRFKAVCPTKEEKKALELIEKSQRISKTDISTGTINVGDNVIYEPMNRKMIVKEITNEGLLVCISYKKNGTEEYEGTYKPEQVRKF